MIRSDSGVYISITSESNINLDFGSGDIVVKGI